MEVNTMVDKEKESVIDSTFNSAFENAEQIRYSKLRAAKYDNPYDYPELNLEGTTMEEILDRKV